MKHERWEHKIRSKYATEYKQEDIEYSEGELLNIRTLEELVATLKKEKKYSRTSYLKKVIEWAKTPYGQAYYNRELKR